MSFEGPSDKKEKSDVTAETQEGTIEKFPTKEAVMEMLAASLEGIPLTVEREVSDADGLILLEVRREGDVPGEVFEYGYTRKGSHQVISKDGISRKIGATTNNIEVTHFQDDMPVWGTTYALYEEEAGTWKVLG